jgi:toxin HigB-1
MILSFKCADTQALFTTGKSRRFASIKVVAERKLTQLQAAVNLESLKAPPGNRLEALHGNRKGQHSIRINDQWRLYFVWTSQGAKDVEIVDYH